MKRDEELYRLENILRAIDELDNRFMMLNHKCGSGAEFRAVQFVKSRKSWFFDRFNKQ
jgi:hypothetical protein